MKMKKIIIISLLLALLLVSGCQKEIDTGVKNCKAIMTSILGPLASEIVDKTCPSTCQTEGMDYKEWKCSGKDTIVCVCTS